MKSKSPKPEKKSSQEKPVNEKTKFSGYAMIDITKGRKALEAHFKSGGEPIGVTMVGNIVCVSGNDDGVSQEFEIALDHVVIQPEDRASFPLKKGE